MGEMITIGDGIPAYQAGDAGPGVVMLQEWWGLNEQMKGLADRLAAEGFRVVVPDLYRGRVTQDPDEANHMMNGLDWMGATTGDVSAVAAHLGQGGAKVGVTGFCMGGALTILSSVHLDNVSAGVCFYGIPPKAAADPAQVKVPFQGHFGTEDDWCNPQAVAALTEDLGKSGATFEIHSYEGRDHAFMNEKRPEVYDAEAAAQAWGRMVAFFKAHLA